MRSRDVQGAIRVRGASDGVCATSFRGCGMELLMGTWDDKSPTLTRETCDAYARGEGTACFTGSLANWLAGRKCFFF